MVSYGTLGTRKELSPPNTLPSPISVSGGDWRTGDLDWIVYLSRTWLRLRLGGRGGGGGCGRRWMKNKGEAVLGSLARTRQSIGQSIDFLRRFDASDGIADSVDICKGEGEWERGVDRTARPDKVG